MAKIGRNAPCPCGSGKKYKKCCSGKKTFETKTSVSGRPYHWNMNEIRQFSTDRIISKLREFGVDFKIEQFEKDVRNYFSGCALARHWEKIHPINANGFDIDFIWMACIVLWERLAPDVFSSEKLEEMIEEGYAAVDQNDSAKASGIWLRAWDLLKPRFPTGTKSLEDAESVFSDSFSIFNWCQDLEMELGNAGANDKIFYEKRIEFCGEYLSLFPESGDETIVAMRRAEAESCFYLGRYEKGENAFRSLVDDYPNSVWTYIGWGDMYASDFGNLQKDHKKAETIYRMGLEKDLEEKYFLIERLEDLEEKKD